MRLCSDVYVHKMAIICMQSYTKKKHKLYVLAKKKKVQKCTE
jgi:hypothetical protein